jgi:hypothetical protein
MFPRIELCYVRTSSPAYSHTLLPSHAGKVQREQILQKTTIPGMDLRLTRIRPFPKITFPPKRQFHCSHYPLLLHDPFSSCPVALHGALGAQLLQFTGRRASHTSDPIHPRNNKISTMKARPAMPRHSCSRFCLSPSLSEVRPPPRLTPNVTQQLEPESSSPRSESLSAEGSANDTQQLERSAFAPPPDPDVAEESRSDFSSRRRPMVSSSRSTRWWRFTTSASLLASFPVAITDGAGRGVELLKARSCSRSAPATETAGVDWELWKEGGGELGIAVL